MRRITLMICALVVAVPLSAQAPATTPQGRAFRTEDWYKLTTVSSPAMSPDGRWVAFTVTTVDEAANKRHSEVWLVASSGGDAMRMTSPGTESSNPRWSRDGSLLLFTSRREGGRGSTWALRMDRTPSGEAFQPEAEPRGSMPKDGLFSVFTEGGSGGFGFSGRGRGGQEETPQEAPAGRRNAPYARMKPMARPPWRSITRPMDARRFDGMQIVDVPYIANGRGFLPNRQEAQTWEAAEVYRQNVGDTAKTKLTDTPYSHRDVQVSPDGRWIAFVADPEMRPDSVVQAERDSLAELPYDAKRDQAPTNDADVFVMNPSRSASSPTSPGPRTGGSGWWTWRVASHATSWVIGNTSPRASTGCPTARWP
jgi:dipeptidyl aminopeptidase/acylaminoacyl peptidase